VDAGRLQAYRAVEEVRAGPVTAYNGSVRPAVHRRRGIERAGGLTCGGAVLCSGRSGVEAAARVGAVDCGAR